MNYETLLPTPQYKKSPYKNGDTNDIVAEVIKCYNVNHAQAAKLAAQLQGSSVKQTCSNIWHFIKNNVTYKIDPEGYQWVRTPSRLIADGEGDCKSFSVLAASLLKCLGITPTFRFTSYNSSPTHTHVYVVAKQKGSKEIIIDAVIDGFNTQKPYTHKKDITMAKIATLSGVNDSTAAYFEQSKAINAAILKSLLPALIKAEATKNAGYIQTPLLNKINNAISKLDAQAIGAPPQFAQGNVSMPGSFNAASTPTGANWLNTINTAATALSSGNALQAGAGIVSTGLSFLGPIGAAAGGLVSLISGMLGGSNPDKDWESWDGLDQRYGNFPPGGQAKYHIQTMGTKSQSSIARTMPNLLSWIKSKGVEQAFKLWRDFPDNNKLTPQQIYEAFKLGGQEAGGLSLANAYNAYLNPNAQLPYGTNNVVNAANNANNTGDTGASATKWLLPLAGGLIAAKVFKVI